MRAARGERPPDPGKRESRPAKAALPNTSASTERGEGNRTHRRCLYRAHPGCALLVKRTLLRCGGKARI